ncbi:Gfo/Idh/MocA family protein [Spongiivirga citrea]|uniref:Gfo/Idh/MocA family oxidoreductase n=1 Tax=Spongiivirga citrea TaxID=1481457 RepID=A0A6M0CIR3_9FLAO|nr:Gfo/Idh/MocA family oxidoreductase [Spongiivirga citrea]NER17838.1 Gfo/Idh/MocA family oxidoreductase [Spongiivirga citrea]
MEKSKKTTNSDESKNIGIQGHSRRKFLQNTTIALAGISLVPRHVLGRGFLAPSDKINLGIIGLGKQGNILANKFISNTNSQIVAGSDVWLSKGVFFKNNVEQLYAKKRNVSSYSAITNYLNYQELIDREDIDAVIVATPDHWHAKQSIDAMNADKDVFCEKPLTNTIADGRDMLRAAKRNKSIVQVGSMQRSWKRFQTAQKIVSSGKLGEIKKVLVNVGGPARAFDLPAQTTPKGIDWNLWCGPARLVTYHERIAPEIVDFYPDWRLFKEFGGGKLTDWGAHMFDVAQWCLGMDHSGPTTFIPPTEKDASRGLKMIYENGIELFHEDFGRGNAVRFIGTEGTLDVSRGFLESTPASIVLSMPGADKENAFKDQGNHYQNWLTCIKTREKPISSIETGHKTATLCNAANIAYELKRPLQWNPDKEKFKGDREANKLRKVRKRKYLN